ncbi:MAG: hypothetical protein TR69_WS6001000039 [candidate division WS6 bacterium OLB20]|uniref:Uncharacterized protein n=1 Tax=candidate division WS6 bacterium OLB20 TaxID=1617426 RepID=A0A136M122_9BACT|nr:MAG: hypothetical protein TR69_WS6001000039 [candidate division WS6 bacterium OLB20]
MIDLFGHNPAEYHYLMQHGPFLLKDTEGPMAEYNPELVEHYRNEYAAAVADGAVLESGSIALKRFTRPQSRQMQALKPGSVIITDEHLFTPDAAKQEGVLYPENVNQLLGMLSGAGKIITTDTYWAWLSGAVVARRSAYEQNLHGQIRNSELMVCYPMALPVCWGVPGATQVVGRILAGKSDYHHEIKQTLGVISSRDYGSFETIADMDMQHFLASAKAFLAGNQTRPNVQV